MSDTPIIKMPREITQNGIDLLRSKGYRVDIHGKGSLSHKELCAFVEGADVLATMLSEKIDDEVMEAAGPRLRLISQFAVGYDNIDLEAAKRRGISVTNTPGSISGPAVAEHAVALMFGVSRHLKEADTFSRKGKYKEWDPFLFLGPQLVGKTVGIVGTGQIGSLFAGICHSGLQMRVLYSDVVRNDAIERGLGARKVELERLLQESDVVSLHVPLLPSTHHLINAERLAMMKPTSILINTARGPVVDEEALASALKSNAIAGAGIDVFEHEPKISPSIIDLPNVVITPHIGSATMDARIGMAECVAKNIIGFFTSGELISSVIK